MIRKPRNLSIFIRDLQKIAPGKGKKTEFIHPVTLVQDWLLQRTFFILIMHIANLYLHFCLISTGLSLFDEANKMKFLKIERA